MKESEVWKEVPGWESYQVSSHGRVKSLKKNLIRKVHPSREGYLQVNLIVGDRRKMWSVHRLVAYTFLGLDLDDKWQIVLHLDDDKTNNHVSNLKVGTYRENNAHMIKDNEWGISKRKDGAYYIAVQHRGERRCTTRVNYDDAIALRDKWWKEMTE